MEEKEWINLIVPIMSNLLISGLVVVYLKNLINRKFDKANKRGQYLIVVMSNLNSHISKLKNHIIMIKSRQIETSENAISQIFMFGGDIQLYIKDFSDYIEQCKRTYHKDIFETKMLDMLLSELTKCGEAMQMSLISNTAADVFANKIDSILSLCQELVQKYNTVLSDV